MAFKDNRQFVNALDKTRDVVHIKREVDWDLEIGAIVRRADELQGPLPYFEKIRDYSRHRILGEPLATYRRLSVALDLPVDSTIRDLKDRYEKLIANPVKPVIVSTGPCKENIVKGDKINLFDFPAPTVHEGDGGRFIGTWDIVVVKDPDSDWTNWGTYRVMIQNKRAVSVMLHLGNDGGRIFYQKYAPMGKAMPIAIVIGADPISTMVSTVRYPSGKSEVEFAGALHDQPIELVKCETSEILVPAHAEIVLEGEVLQHQMVPEGPFGEFTGYRTEWDWQEVCVIKAITYRNNPILTLFNTGIGDGALASRLVRSINLKNALKACGVPVVDVHIPSESVGMSIVVSIKKLIQDNMATLVANVIRCNDVFPQKIIVVDPDVDIYNLSEVFHTLATRLHPGRGISIEYKDRAMGLSPFLSTTERKWNRSASVLFDCTWPSEWSRESDIPPRISFRDAYPPELQEKVKKEWHEYGFD